jgi:hypothetical protein
LHGLLDVIDPDYVPTTEKEQELLTLKNNFMFAVWAMKLLTPSGKQSVRRHRATGDAQAVWREIQHDALKTIVIPFTPSSQPTSIQTDLGSHQPGTTLSTGKIKPTSSTRCNLIQWDDSTTTSISCSDS